MATTTKFHQINQFVSRVERATNAAHLSWMQRFADRINTLIIVPLDTDGNPVGGSKGFQTDSPYTYPPSN